MNLSRVEGRQRAKKIAELYDDAFSVLRATFLPSGHVDSEAEYQYTPTIYGPFQ